MEKYYQLGITDSAELEDRSLSSFQLKMWSHWCSWTMNFGNSQFWSVCRLGLNTMSEHSLYHTPEPLNLFIHTPQRWLCLLQPLISTSNTPVENSLAATFSYRKMQSRGLYFPSVMRCSIDQNFWISLPNNFQQMQVIYPTFLQESVILQGQACHNYLAATNISYDSLLWITSSKRFFLYSIASNCSMANEYSLIPFEITLLDQAYKSHPYNLYVFFLPFI